MQRRLAFFDVDGTLTTSSSMFRLLAYYLDATGRPRRDYEELMLQLKAMFAMGCSREATNRAYFASLQGLDADLMSLVAGEWFTAETATGHYYHEPATAELRRHQQRGDHVVLVSGSFPAPISLVAADLGVDEVWCTEPQIVHGRYTGDLKGPPMIGRAKADAVLKATSRQGSDPSRCIAYGDHASDLPMLQAVGSAVVVGGDAGLRSVARARGWRQLPGVLPAPEPAPLPRRILQETASRGRQFINPYGTPACHTLPETS
ncbi:HAD family hydrolase [Streptomyces boninensis]|uniref:HAD family hydrolase n=1 Tax=Streptomyces boninensis TaxID=2039455 RepID=UPI003B214F7D